MKKVLFPIIALILVVCLAPVMAAPVAATWTGNLLVNPGAEAGDMTWWTYSTGPSGETPEAKESLVESCGTVLPNSGNYFFTMGLDGAASPASMEQEIDLSGLGGTPVTFEAGGRVQTEKYWEPGWPESGDPGDYDRGALFVEFFNAGGGSLGVFPLDPVEHPCCEQCGVPLTYDDFFLTGAVPDGAASAVYRLEGYRIQSMYINVFFDDLFFSVDVAPPSYDLTVNSTAGGSVTEPGEGTFTYDEGTVVDLLAVPDPGYTFVDWTGNVGTVADPDAADTTITMNGDYSITANFSPISPPPVGGTIIPTDKLGLVMPWIMASALIVVAGVSLALWNRKRGTERASRR